MIKTEEEFRKYLYTLQDKKYKEFHSSIANVDNVIGVRVPTLREIAKKLSQDDYMKFFSFNHETNEELMIHGMTIGYLKVDFDEKLRLLDIFLNQMNGWSVCDSTCSTLKDFRKNQAKGFEFIKKLIDDKRVFARRTAFVLLLNYYINDDYIDEVIKIIINYDYTENEYYVLMAIAWLISFCYIKYPKNTLEIYENYKLNEFVINKSISKINDSFRVEKEQKELLKKYRIK